MAYSTPDALVSGDILTLARYNKIKDSVIANAHAVFPLGGSRVMVLPVVGATAQDAVDYIEFEVPTSDSGGHVYKVVCEIKTENAATTVTPRLYNVTDASVNWTGSAGTSTAWGTYQVSSSLTIAAGKKYRLQFTKSDDLYESWGIGVIRRTAA
jgi:hypothetical protein